MANTNLSARIICVANFANQVAEPRTVFGPVATYPPTILSLLRNPALPWSDGSLGMGDASTAMSSVEDCAEREGSVFSVSNAVRAAHALPHGRSGSSRIRVADCSTQSAKPGAGKSLVAV